MLDEHHGRGLPMAVYKYGAFLASPCTPVLLPEKVETPSNPMTISQLNSMCFTLKHPTNNAE